MTDKQHEVIFRGDLAPGHHIDDVKQNLATLFKTDLSGIAHLFTGKLVVVKSGLDEANANRYKDAMQSAGALVSVRQQKESTPAVEEAAAEPAASDTGGLSLAPLGADILPRKDQAGNQTPDIATDHITVADVGKDVLKESEKQPFVERDIDTSHLEIQ